MTTVKQLLEMPIGSKTGGFSLAIKTAKKKWQVAGYEWQVQVKDRWMHQVVLMDSTGEILADVNIGTYSPLIAGNQIHIIVCEVQDSEYLNKPCKKLYIDQFERPTNIGEPPMDYSYGESVKTIRSKILCLHSVASTRRGDTTAQTLEFLKDPITKDIVDKIMEG